VTGPAGHWQIVTVPLGLHDIVPVIGPANVASTPLTVPPSAAEVTARETNMYVAGHEPVPSSSLAPPAVPPLSVPLMAQANRRGGANHASFVMANSPVTEVTKAYPVPVHDTAPAGLSWPIAGAWLCQTCAIVCRVKPGPARPHEEAPRGSGQPRERPLWSGSHGYGCRAF
jgi:hypothetical protein